MARRYRYLTLDVFTDRAFCGNPLAVLPDAAGLADAEMQRIAAEFGYPETTFVLPPDDPAHDARVRIFTPKAEVPFAGHPNVGTAVALARLRIRAGGAAPERLLFEELAGLVAVDLVAGADGAPAAAHLTAPQALSLGDEIPVAAAAALAALPADAVVTARHPPTVAGVGLPFLMVELADRAALERARPDAARFADTLPMDKAVGVELYVRAKAGDDVDLRARMFAPLFGVDEDPATGSANAGLAGLLAHLDPTAEGTLSYRIAQGVEMGRPSLLEASAVKRGGAVEAVRIGGGAVPVMEGELALAD